MPAAPAPITATSTSEGSFLTRALRRSRDYWLSAPAAEGGA